MASFSSFDPSQVSSFGTTGRETAKTMNKAVQEHNLSLIFDSGSKQFTVTNSSSLSKESVQKIFDKYNYQAWEPLVTDETDKEGNFQVRLRAISTSRFNSSLNPSARHPAYAVFPHVKSATRDDFARELVSKIERNLGITLKGKEIIDVGCRSGENCLAMQEAGANVIGIDPDDREFETARTKGMEEPQLIKATLQEYAQKSDKEFDIATVFLWNIPLKEKPSFVNALKSVIRPGGYVIIGYADEPYDKDPEINVPKLMRTAFSVVNRYEFPSSLNKYMLVCSFPL